MPDVTDQQLNQLRSRPVVVRLRTADPERTWDMHAELASYDPVWVQLRNARAGQRTFPVRRDLIAAVEPDTSAQGARAGA
jgi:hypothetical protein